MSALSRTAAVALSVVALILPGGLTAQQRTMGAVRPGDLAPDFTLEPRGGGSQVSLSSFRGRSPVAIVFGSYT